MGGVLDRVDIDQGAGLMGECGQGFHIVHTAGEIAGVNQRQQPGSVIQQCCQRLWLDLPAAAIKIKPADSQTVILGHLQPGGDITLVFHAGYDDFIPGGKAVGQAAGQLIGQGGHVGPDDDLTRVGRTQKIGHGADGFLHHGVNGHRGTVEYAGIAVVAVKEIGDAVNAVLGHLGTRRIIKIDAPTAIIGGGERGKHPAHLLNGKLP